MVILRVLQLTVDDVDVGGLGLAGLRGAAVAPWKEEGKSLESNILRGIVFFLFTRVAGPSVVHHQEREGGG